MGEKERHNGLCAVLRGRFEEVRPMRNGLVLVACLPHRTRVMSELLPRAMSRSIGQQQPVCGSNCH